MNKDSGCPPRGFPLERQFQRNAISTLELSSECDYYCPFL